MWNKVKALHWPKLGFCSSLPQEQKPDQKPECVFSSLHFLRDFKRGKKKNTNKQTHPFFILEKQ